MPVRTHVWKGQEMPLAYQRTDPEGEALAGAMLALRRKLGETQEQHCFRYRISKWTYIRWERFGPPKRVPTREFVKLIMRGIKLKTKGKKHGKAKNQNAKDVGATSAADE